MADYRDDLVIDELLRNLGRSARIRGVVLPVQHQRDLLTANRQPFRVAFLNRKARAILNVFAKVRDLARRRSGIANLDSLLCVNATAHSKR
ncbi:hypothetical protein GCM10027093_31660 [Paraburkholderia jirisanensis]